jgi:hypothetical protein
MGGVDGVAHQHHIAVVPFVTGDGRELEPPRVVPEQAGAIQTCREDLLAASKGKLVAMTRCRHVGSRGIEAQRGPGLGAHLDYEGAPLLAVGIDVGPDHSRGRVLEYEVELVEHLRCAEPDVLVASKLDRGPQVWGELATQHAVGAVSADDHFCPAQLRQAPYLGRETEIDAQAPCPVGQDLEQRTTTDGREAVSPGDQIPAIGMTHSDLTPAPDTLGQSLIGLGVGHFEMLDCLVAEDDTESVGVPGQVPLEDPDLEVRS